MNQKPKNIYQKGDAKKNRIIADTDRKVKELLSTAEADAEVIRAEGEAGSQRKSIIQLFPKIPNSINYTGLLNPTKKRLEIKQTSFCHRIPLMRAC